MGARFDREALLDRIDEDVELLGELFQDYLEDKEDHLEKVRQAVESSDMKLLYDGAHALRGCVANFCANTAFKIATELQDLASANGVAQAGAVAAKLENEIEQLTKELRAFVEESKAG